MNIAQRDNGGTRVVRPDAVASQFAPIRQVVAKSMPNGDCTCAFSFPVGTGPVTLDLSGAGPRSAVKAIRCPRAAGNIKIIAASGEWRATLDLKPDPLWWTAIEVDLGPDAYSPLLMVKLAPRPNSFSVVEVGLLPVGRFNDPPISTQVGITPMQHADRIADTIYAAMADGDFSTAVAIANRALGEGAASRRFREAQIKLIELVADDCELMHTAGALNLLVSLSA